MTPQPRIAPSTANLDTADALFAVLGVTPRTWQRLAVALYLDGLASGTVPAWVIQACTGAGKSYVIAALVLHAVRHGIGQIVVVPPTVQLVEQIQAMLERQLQREVGVYYTGGKDTHHDVMVVCSPSLASFVDATERSCSLAIIDECHRSEADQVKPAVERMGPSVLVGMTATPFRTKRAETLSLFPGGLLYRHTNADAVKHEDVVPLDVRRWDGHGRSASDVDGIVLDMIRRHGLALGPGVVNAPTIADAELYTAYLNDQGVRAATIHSRLPRAVVEERLEQLRTGEIDALVHVSMLVEGVDLPWLRWIALRRNTRSVLRLAQEVGRVVRTAPGKDRAVVLDPLDLIHRHGLDRPAALGVALDDADDEDADGIGQREDTDHDGVVPLAVAVDEVGRWLRELLAEMRAHGLAKPPEFDAGPWRDRAPSERLLCALGRMQWASKFLPVEHREGVAALCAPDVAGCLRQGDASDLLGVLGGLADGQRAARQQRRRFAWPSTVSIRPLDLQAIAARLECAA